LLASCQVAKAITFVKSPELLAHLRDINLPIQLAPTKETKLSNFACWRLALQHRLTRFPTYLPKPVRTQNKEKQLQKTKQQLIQAPNKKNIFFLHTKLFIFYFSNLSRDRKHTEPTCSSTPPTTKKRSSLLKKRNFLERQLPNRPSYALEMDKQKCIRACGKSCETMWQKRVFSPCAPFLQSSLGLACPSAVHL